jgi:hypothetical protein
MGNLLLIKDVFIYDVNKKRDRLFILVILGRSGKRGRLLFQQGR